MIFQQLFEKISSTYTYIIADTATHEGLIIDPVFETFERDLNYLQEAGITLRYILDTHIHADHITGSGHLAQKTGAKIAMSAASGMDVDILLEDGQLLRCGSLQIKALATPGHTSESMCYVIGNKVFTGDTLLIRGNGRTDFQNGSAQQLYQSIMNKLYTLPDDTIVYSGHDYAGFTSSTIALEKKYNKRIKADTTEEQFVHTMSQLKLDRPQKIDIAVPANLRCVL